MFAQTEHRIQTRTLTELWFSLYFVTSGSKVTFLSHKQPGVYTVYFTRFNSLLSNKIENNHSTWEKKLNPFFVLYFENRQLTPHIYSNENKVL